MIKTKSVALEASMRLQWFSVLMLAALVLTLTSCSRRPPVLTTSPVPVQNAKPKAKSKRVFHVLPGNPSQTEVGMQLQLDGRNIYSEKLSAHAQAKELEIPVGRGWHKLQTAIDSRPMHTAFIEADCEKWVLVRYEPSKAEQVGVHIAEYPLH